MTRKEAFPHTAKLSLLMHPIRQQVRARVKHMLDRKVHFVKCMLFPTCISLCEICLSQNIPVFQAISL